MTACSTCGFKNATEARFCSACGAALGAERRPEVRKTITLLFCDIAGSTSMGEGRDAEAVRAVMDRYFAEMAAIVRKHGGTVEKFVGDAIMAAFGIPVVHEDDAARAVRAAAEMRQALGRLNEDLEAEWGLSLAVRTGVNTGEVISGDPTTRETFATGDTVNTAARLEQAAGAGEILLGDTTYRLVKDFVRVEDVPPLTLKGKTDPVPAHRLIEVVPAASTRPARAPMVGRDRELAFLLEELRRAAAEHTCRLVTIIGEPGVGKSRLVAEFVASAAPSARILRGRCLSYGEGITFWPVAEVVRQAAGIDEEDALEQATTKIELMVADLDGGRRIGEVLASLLGLVQTATPIPETFWAVRTALEGLARRSPVAVVIDDIHWAEPTLLDLLADIVRYTTGSALLLCCPARPELEEIRPGWGSGLDAASSITLRPLDGRESERLVAEIVGSADLGDLGSRVTEVSAGNPLFVEEMLSMLIDDGVLLRDDGRWVVAPNAGDVSVPPTISALIAARLDRLPFEERAVVELASVVGKEFERSAVAALAATGTRDVDAPLAALVRRDFITARASVGSDGYAFRHQLIRDGAYEGMAKRLRSDLHGRVAEWLEETSGERLPEVEEIVGYHLEQAYRYRSELRPPTGADRELAARAVDHLSNAGRRAHGRGDAPAAANLFGRGLALLPEGHGSRVGPLIQLAEALQDLGEFERAHELALEAQDLAGRAGDRGLVARAAIAQMHVRLFTDPEGWAAKAEPEIRRLVEEFGTVGDDAGSAKAWDLLTEVHWIRGEFGDVDEAVARSNEHARRAGDLWIEARSLQMGLSSALWGPLPVSAGIRRCEDLLREEAGRGRAIEAAARWALAGLTGMSGRFDEARALASEARTIRETLGQRLLLAASQVESTIEMLAGDPVAAEAWERSGIDQLERMGERGFLSTKAARVAHALYAQGRDDESLRFSELSEETAPSDDQMSQVMWRGARAKVLARRGSIDEAESLARDGVALAERSDDLNTHGDALLDLAVILRAASREAEAVEPIREALALFERKENLVSAGRARGLLEELTARD